MMNTPGVNQRATTGRGACALSRTVAPFGRAPAPVHFAGGYVDDALILGHVLEGHDAVEDAGEDLGDDEREEYRVGGPPGEQESQRDSEIHDGARRTDPEHPLGFASLAQR